MLAGQTVVSQIVVGNKGATTVAVRVYPVNGITSPDTGAVYANFGAKAAGQVTWVTPEVAGKLVNTVVLPSDKEQRINVVVKVPVGTKPGDYLAGVAVQQLNQKAGTGHGAIHISIVERTIIGILVNIPGKGLGFRLKLGVPKIVAETAGLGTVSTPLVASGNRLGAPLEDVWLTGPSPGQLLGRQLNTILPTASIPDPVVWATTLKAGIYHIRYCVYGGGLPARICTTGSTNLLHATPGYKTPKVKTVIIHQKTSTLLLALIGGLGALVLILIIGFFIFFLIWKRRRDEDEEEKERRRQQRHNGKGGGAVVAVAADRDSQDTPEPVTSSTDRTSE